jgi:hypothetical protein
MKTKIVYILLIVIVLVGGYFVLSSKNNSSGTNTTIDSSTYKNTDYNFSVSLPKSWEGYTVVKSSWQGDAFFSSGQKVEVEEGPLISIRHPLWTESSPRQDIPVMVFTLKQWNDMQADKFHIGAAPINPSELSRNGNYVFALPARYNFSYLTGYEEVDQIIKSGAVKAF